MHSLLIIVAFQGMGREVEEVHHGSRLTRVHRSQFTVAEKDEKVEEMSVEHR